MIYWLAFNMGIIGSLHCVAMCGPLSLMSVSANTENNSNFAMFAKSLLYQFGRTFSYMLLGLIFGLVGQIFEFGGLQQVLAITMGLMMIIVAIFSLNIDVILNKSRVMRALNKHIMDRLSQHYKKHGQGSQLFVGILNGLIPCGLVYFALASAATSPTLIGAGLFMVFFGLGTVPMMTSFALFGSKLKKKMRFDYSRIMPWFAFFVGIVLVWRGLNIVAPLDLKLLLSMKNPILCH